MFHDQLLSLKPNRTDCPIREDWSIVSFAPRRLMGGRTIRITAIRQSFFQKSRYYALLIATFIQ